MNEWSCALLPLRAQLVSLLVVVALAAGCATEQRTSVKFAGRSAEVWIASLNDRSEAHRDSAVQALAAIGKEAVPLLIPVLQNDDSTARRAAARALFAIGPEAEEAFPTLLEQELASADGLGTALQSGRLLGPGIIGPLLSFMGRSSADAEYLRINGGIALASLGPMVIPTLTHALSDANGYVRYGAAEALGHLGPEGADAITNLIEVMSNRSEEEAIRDRASRSLANIGPAARSALQALLSVPDPATRRLARLALEEIVVRRR